MRANLGCDWPEGTPIGGELSAMRVGCMNVMVNETGSGTLGYVVRKLPSLRASSHCGQRIEEAKAGLRETGDARGVEFTVKFASAYFGEGGSSQDA